MTAEEVDQKRKEFYIAEINETIDHYTKFEDELIFERALHFTLDKVPLRMKGEVANQAIQHMRDKWPHMFNEKGEPKK